MQESVKDVKAEFDVYEAKFFAKVKGFRFYLIYLLDFVRFCIFR